MSALVFFYVRLSAMKQDVVPGRYYTAGFERAHPPGDYAIDCAEELCVWSHFAHSRQGAGPLPREGVGRWLDSRPTRGPTRPSSRGRGRDVAVGAGLASLATPIDGQPSSCRRGAGLFYSTCCSRRRKPRHCGMRRNLTAQHDEPGVEGRSRSYNPVLPTSAAIPSAPEVAAPRVVQSVLERSQCRRASPAEGGSRCGRATPAPRP